MPPIDPNLSSAKLAEATLFDLLANEPQNEAFFKEHRINFFEFPRGKH